MSVASKNLYALLGNDEEDETPRAPVKTVEKATTRTTKRNVEPEAPARLPAGGSSAARRGGAGNDGAFRDRAAGSDRNRTRNTEAGDAKGAARGGYAARGRGGRGGRFPRERDDRHTKGPAAGNSEKQAAHGWGATEGNAELKDEQAGEAIAEGEQKEAAAADAEPVEAQPEEPEEKQVAYADYIAELAEKKAALNSGIEVRRPNEGNDKKWGQGTAVEREEEDFMAGTGGKAKREREKKQKQYVEIDQRFVEQPERSTRGGPRGGGRGGPRGGARGGDRGDRAERGGERGRGGAPRGGNAPRGAPRQNNAASINTKDESAFPSLGK